MTTFDADDADETPFDLELPAPLDDDKDDDGLPDDASPGNEANVEVPLPPAAPSLSGDDDDVEAFPLETYLGTLSEEPSVLGADESGFLSNTHDDGIDEASDTHSFLGKDEAPSVDGESDLDDDIVLGTEDGGAEGLEDPESEAVDELPPLDGHEDGREDDLPDEAFAPELAQLGVS